MFENIIADLVKGGFEVKEVCASDIKKGDKIWGRVVDRSVNYGWSTEIHWNDGSVSQHSNDESFQIS